MFDEYHYVPVLKGKQGEYGALAEADDRVRSSITPLIEIPSVPYDFAAEEPAKSAQAHVGEVAKKIERCWGGERRFFLDAGLLAEEDQIDGRHPLAVVLDDARELGLQAVPVTGVARSESYDAAVEGAVSADQRGICLRLVGEDLEEPEELPEVVEAEVMAALGLKTGEVDLVLDLGSISAEQRWTGATVRLLLAALPEIGDWRSLTLIASSFPLDLSGIDGDSTALIPRAEWAIWRALHARADRLGRLPSFGDYAISHPAPREVDPRIIQRSAAIRYSADDEFLILKGRSIQAQGSEQHYDLAAELVNRPEFHGEDFSWGDAYVASRARRQGGPGSGTTWRKAGTSQHLALVTTQIANLRDA